MALCLPPFSFTVSQLMVPIEVGATVAIGVSGFFVIETPGPAHLLTRLVVT